MSVDTAFRRLQEANPVPRPATLRERDTDLSVLLTATLERSTDMQTKQPDIEPKEKKARGRVWEMTWVTALIVLSVGLANFASSRPDLDVAATPPETAHPALVAAQGFFSALSDGDLESAVALLTPDLAEDPVVTNGIEFLVALDADWTLSDCRTSTVGETSAAPCLLTIDHPLFHATGETEETALVSVDDQGRIRMRPQLGSRSGFDQAIRHYAAETDPEGFDRVCATDAVEEPGTVQTATGYQWTGACGELISRLSDDIVAWVESAVLETTQGYFGALTDGDVESAMALLTADLAEDPVVTNGIEFLVALDADWALSDCRTSTVGETSAASCLLTIDHPLFHATGETEDTAQVSVDENGLIQRRPRLGDRSGVDEAITGYLAAVEPEAFDRVCAPGAVEEPGTVQTATGYQWTGACGDLVNGATDEIVAWIEAGD
jgi:hypothetical protein